MAEAMTQVWARWSHPTIPQVRKRAIHFRMAAESFDWSLVKSFLAVLDAGSLMGAARREQARQPTLSRHIAELEAQLGVPLFERTGRGVVATAAGLAIADAARQMQDGADQLGRSLQRQSQATSGTVRITTSDVAAAWLLPPLLAALRDAEPGIQVELVASNALANLLRREADIAVRMLRPTQGSLVARKLGEIAICAAAHETYLQRAGTPRQPQDLLQHSLIGYDKDHTIESGFARLGLPLPRSQFVLRTDNQIVYSQLLAAGAGIGFIAAYTVPLLPGVRPLLPMLKIPPLPCWLAVHREIRGSPVVRRVYDFLAEALPPALAG
jgi:DNA-binding transcriptional LysR family regulator